MPLKRMTELWRKFRSLGVFAAIALSALPLPGQDTFTWTGAGGDDNWSTAGNWGGSAPDTPQKNLHFAGSTRLTPNNNLSSYGSGFRIFFNSGASSFTLNGNPIKFFDFGGNRARVQNDSADAQTINLRVGAGNSAGGLDINANSGDIVYAGGSIDNGTIFLDGSSQLRFEGNSGRTVTLHKGIIDGNAAGSVAIRFNTIVIYNAASTYTGGTFLDAGQLHISTNGSLSGTIFLGPTSGSADSAVYIQPATGSKTVSNAINVRSGGSGTITLGGLNTSGENTFSGTITLTNNVVLSAASGGSLTFSGILRTDGATRTATANSAGTVTLGGSADNVNLALTVTSGTAVLGKTSSSSVHAVGAGLTISGGTVQLGGSGADQLWDGSTSTSDPITINGGTFDLNGRSEGINGLSGSGGAILNNASGTTNTLTNGLSGGSGTYSGTIADGNGTLALIKTGSGTLTLDGANTHSGGTTLSGGTLAIGADGALGRGTFTLQNSPTIRSSDANARTITNVLGNLSGSSVNVTFGATSGGTGALTFTNNYNLGSSATRTFTVNNTTTFNGSISGEGGTKLVKAGPGTLVFNGSNSWGHAASPGAFTLNAGTAHLNNAFSLGGTSNRFMISGGTIDNTSAGSITLVNYTQAWNGNFTFTGTQPLNFGAGPVTLSNSCQVTLSSSTLTVGGTVDFQNSASDTARTLTITGAGDAALNGNFINAASGASVLSKGGSGTLTLGGSNAIHVLYNHGGGIISISSSNNIGIPTGVNYPDKFNFTDNATLRVTANSFTLGRNVSGSDNAGFRIQGTKTGTFDIAGDSTLTLDGTIIDLPSTGAGALAKTGTGTLALNQPSTYSGGTTVSAGTLLVNNTSGSGAGSSAVIIESGGTLGGMGIVSGVVTIQSGGTLAPGASIGTLTLGSSPSLSGDTTMEINKSGATVTADKLVVSGNALVYGGTLSVSSSGDTLSGGELFDLFDATSFSGTFSSTNLPALASGLNWWSGDLATDGTLLVNRAPTANNATFSRTPGLSLKIKIADLLSASTSDADGHPRTLQSIGSAANGGALSSDSTYIYYTSASDVADSFNYTVSDAYGGSATALVGISIADKPSGSAQTITTGGGTVTVNFAGIPGFTYDIERSEDLNVWSLMLTTNTPANGRFNFTDTSPPSPTAYYRLKQN